MEGGTQQGQDIRGTQHPVEVCSCNFLQEGEQQKAHGKQATSSLSRIEEGGDTAMSSCFSQWHDCIGSFFSESYVVPFNSTSSSLPSQLLDPMVQSK